MGEGTRETDQGERKDRWTGNGKGEFRREIRRIGKMGRRRKEKINEKQARGNKQRKVKTYIKVWKGTERMSIYKGDRRNLEWEIGGMGKKGRRGKEKINE